MDRDDDFRIIVKRILQEIALMLPSEEKVETEFVCDDTLGHYPLGQIILAFHPPELRMYTEFGVA